MSNHAPPKTYTACPICGVAAPPALSSIAAQCDRCRAGEAERMRAETARLDAIDVAYDAAERNRVAVRIQRDTMHTVRRCVACKVELSGGWLLQYCEPCKQRAIAAAQQRDGAPRDQAGDPERAANLPSGRPPKDLSGIQQRDGVGGLGDALAASGQWAEGAGPPWLVLVGPPGVGKSHLAEGAARAALARGERVRWETVPELLDRLRQFATDDGRADRNLAHLAATPYLILDDLDKLRPTDWALERLYVLVNARAWQERRTLITCNEGQSGLAARLGGAGDTRAEAIADRVFDAQIGRVCVITGPSARGG